MNFRDLKYLVAVADEQHFGRAAQLTHVSQPTLSMQLKKLEESLGVQLFERNSKQVMTTPIGQEVVRRARIILREADGLRDIAKAAQNPFAGELRLGVFPTLAPYFLPSAIPEIRSTLPALKLLIIEEKTDKLIARVKEGALDAALLALPIAEEGLEATVLFDDPFLLAVPPDHALAKRKQVNQKDIAHESLLLLEEGHCLRAQALEVCELSGASEHDDFRATSLETLRQMVVAGVGITLIPKLAARADDGVVYIPFARPVPSRTIGIVWRRQTARRKCLEALKQIFLKTQVG